MSRNLRILTLSIAVCAPCLGQGAESALWQQFKSAKLSGAEPALPDFSYAGYDYSESPLPDTSGWPVFDVTAYGAVPDDGAYDDAGIQAAINAAEAAGGGIVFFPPGRFMVSFDNDITKTIRISSSNMLLKGSGSGPGGTEIFMDQMKVNNGRFMFEVKPLSTSQSTLTTVTANAPRESYEIQVENAAQLWPGRRIILRADSVAYAHAYYDPLPLSPDWTRLVDSPGFNIRELHTVASVQGNKVRLREPLHLPIIIGEGITIQVRSVNVITNVGVEDIRFKGNWDSYPESFVHHKDDIHDYAWNALRFDNVANGWLRDCEFKDWNQGVYFDGCSAFTVENVHFTGKLGHMSIHTRRSYGILIRDCVDTAGHWHGPGVGYWGCGTVYLRHQMAGNQRIDAHSGSPYATLMDGVTGGHFDGNGGPHESYPHHGRHFVAWNFTVSGGPNSYNFWPSTRNAHTFAMPIFAGLQGKSISMTGHQVNESPGTAVQPASLFEVQLQLRLGPTARTDPASAVDENGATLNGALLSAGRAETTIRIYWGHTDGGDDPDAWDGFEDLGIRAVGPFSSLVTGLVAGSTYHYRVRAANSYYEVWADETESFTIPGAPMVIHLLQNDATGTSSFNSGLNWEGGQAPSAFNDYVTAFQLRAPNTGEANYTFAGASLRVDPGGALAWTGSTGTPSGSLTVDNLILNGGTVSSFRSDSTLTMIGSISVTTESNLTLGSSANQTALDTTRHMILNAPVTGSARLRMTAQNAQANVLTVNGDNSGFSGGFLLRNTNAEYIHSLLAVGHVNALGAGTVTIEAGILNLNGFSVGIGGLAGPNASGNAVQNNSNTAATLTVNSGSDTAYAGVIQDGEGDGNLGLTKQGPGALALTGTSTYTGATRISEGALEVIGSLGNTTVSLEALAILAGNGNLGGSVHIESGAIHRLAVAETPANQLTRVIAGALTLDPGNVLTLTADVPPEAGTYILVTAGGGITGALGAVNLPEGVSGTVAVVGDHIELTVAGDSPYADWAGGEPFAEDASGDGIPNGLAFLLGAADPWESALHLLPAASEHDGALVLTFTMLNASGSASLHIEHSSDLGIEDHWVAVAVPQESGGPVNGVSFVVTPGNPFNTVTATIASTEAEDGRLFARLAAAED